MTQRILYIATLIGLFATFSLNAQETQPNEKNAEKIRGSRFIPYPNYPGSSFLNSKFLLGEIEFTDGSKVSRVGINYGTYRDELIYYNTTISTQIVIDKSSLKGFSFTDKNGDKRIFRRQFFNGYFHDDCFFEVLSDGKISLLAYRKVSLEACDTYNSKSGMAFTPAYSYYLYESGKGYIPVNCSRNSLLSKFSKPNIKLIKKTLRKNGVFISDETSFVNAWNLIAELNVEPVFN